MITYIQHKMTNPARTPEFRAMQDSLARTNERAKAAEVSPHPTYHGLAAY